MIATSAKSNANRFPLFANLIPAFARVTKLFLQVVGWTIAHTPEPILSGLCAVLGRLMLWLSRRRRRVVFSNLDHAYPLRSRDWQKKIAGASSRRLFETALLSLAGPFLTPQRLRKMIHLSPEVDGCFAEHHTQPFPLIVAAPHMAYWESLTWMGLFISTPLPEFGIIFRPLNNPTADAWVKSTRERFGMRLLSRKTGLQEAFKILKRKAVVGVLFDQNAGMQGALTTLCGRICSTTELPGLLAERSGARIIAYYARRLDFWRVRFELVHLPYDGTAPGAILALNCWLEKALETDDNLCSSWLWSHDRWRNQDIPERRFRLEAKRDLMREDLLARGLSELPRKTRIWIRMPNWLGDVMMTLPLLRALRVSRPDAEITLVAKPSFEPLLAGCDVADRFEPLPPRRLGYFRHFWGKRSHYPDVYVLFTHSTRGDLEAWLTRSPQRFGVVRAGRKRSLLTHTYVVPNEFIERDHHQLELWEAFFRRFGLAGPLDRSPLRFAGFESPASPLPPLPPLPPRPPRPQPIIGLIAGSENSPEKRWPVEQWRTLLRSLYSEFPYATFLLFGTAGDLPIAAAIIAGLDVPAENLAGKTNLYAYMDQLRQCSLLVSNDTGGMHLANALGVPVVALFGPTNPVRTGPVYSAPCRVVQPPGCPPTGGMDMAQLPADAVLAAVREFLPAALARE